LVGLGDLARFYPADCGHAKERSCANPVAEPSVTSWHPVDRLALAADHLVHSVVLRRCVARTGWPRLGSATIAPVHDHEQGHRPILRV
jgi:hypothetical protein